MIEEANIQVDGLTVIAGENDTGKSTIGKLIYSIIKTFNRYEIDIRSSRSRQIQVLFDDFYRSFQKSTADPVAYESGKKLFVEFEKEALTWLNIDDRAKEEIEKEVSHNVNSFSETLQDVFGGGIDSSDFIEKIVGALLTKPVKEDVHKQAFRKYAYSVLHGEIANKYNEKKDFSITGREGAALLFEISGTDEDVTVNLKDELYLEDATFIESPVLLNIADNIRLSRTEFDVNGEMKKIAESIDRAYAPEYMRDFIMKMTDKLAAQNILTPNKEILDMMKGNFYYDAQERDFVFEKGTKNDKQTFKGAAIASGVKHLGIISILLQAGFFNKKTLLIFDEPENHLHPAWQVKIAEIIVNAVKEGGNILLTSHSPYFIEALKIFSAKKLEKERVAFYLSRSENGGRAASIGNVTEDISPIFSLLSAPFRELERIDAADLL